MSNAIVSVDEETLKGDLRELVRKTVQDTINALLEEEADEMVGAERYERTAGREAYRSGHYKKKARHHVRRGRARRAEAARRHVPEVKHYLLFGKQVVAARHLRQPGEAGAHARAVAPAVDALLELFEEGGALGAKWSPKQDSSNR